MFSNSLLVLRSANRYVVALGSIFGVVSFKPNLDHVSDEGCIERAAVDISANYQQHGSDYRLA